MGLLNKLMGKKEEDTSNKTAKAPSKPPVKPSNSQDLNQNNDQDLTGPTSIPQDSDVASMIGDDSNEADKNKNNKVLNPANALLKKQEIDQNNTSSKPKPPVNNFNQDSGMSLDTTQNVSSNTGSDKEDAMAQLKKSIGDSKPQTPKNNVENVEDENAKYEIPDFDDDLDIDIDVDDIIGEAKNRKDEESEDDDMDMMFGEVEDSEDESEDTPVHTTKKLPRFEVNEAQISKELGYTKGSLFINRLKYAEVLRKEQSLSKDLSRLDSAVKELKNLAMHGDEEYEEFNHNLQEVQDDVMRIDYMIFEAKR